MAGTATGAALPLETANTSGVAADDKVAILVAHQVAQETAALSTEVEGLKSENATLKTEVAGLKDKLDVAETAKTAAEKAFADYKGEQAAAAERAKLADARKAEVAKVAPALEATDERLARWTSMDEAAFTEYVAELASVAGGKTGEGAGTETFDASKGETAMDRSKKTTSGKSAARSVLGLG